MEVGKRKKGKNLTPDQLDLVIHILMNPESSRLSQDDLVKKMNDELSRWYKRKLSPNYLKKKLIPQLKKKLPEEKTWCIGSSEGIPLETMRAVLGASKQAKIEGKSLTVREAKWCARLSSLIEDTRTLLSVASGYANREIIHEAKAKHNQPFDTSNLDKILTMDPWELATACLTKEIKPIGPSIPKFEIRPERLSFLDAAVPYEPMTIFEPLRTVEIAPDILETQADDAQMSFIVLTPWSSKDILSTLTRRMSIPIEFTKEQFIDMRRSLRGTLTELHFSQEQMRVFTLWLEYMATGPSVQELKFENRVEMVDELREWVKKHELAKDFKPKPSKTKTKKTKAKTARVKSKSSMLLPFSPEGIFVGSFQEEKRILNYGLEPLELLEKVGIKSILEVEDEDENDSQV